VLLFRAETLAGAFPGAEPEVYFVTATPGISRAEITARLQAVVPNGVTVRPLTVDTGSLNAFGLAFWLVAALVLAVALANLGSTMALGVRERARDSGVLRAIGFTPRQLRGSTAITALLLIIGAVIIGVPAGLLLGRSLLEGVGKAIGAGPELRAAPPLALTALFVGLMAIVAVAIGVLTCVQTSRRPVSELMRYE
jgi:putative ABC transport system permease protein